MIVFRYASYLLFCYFVLRVDISLELDAGWTIANSTIYNNHMNSITHARFSKTGSMCVSADIDGLIKLVFLCPK